MHWEASVKFFVSVPRSPGEDTASEADEEVGEESSEEASRFKLETRHGGHEWEEAELKALSRFVGPFLCENLAYRLTEARRKLHLSEDVEKEVTLPGVC